MENSRFQQSQNFLRIFEKCLQFGEVFSLQQQQPLLDFRSHQWYSLILHCHGQLKRLNNIVNREKIEESWIFKTMKRQ
jgi:hypothetical protein